tara:strand:+ start:514 stop:1515 length:1002 start_codon:yes stop_codon:yes gene_type:complete
MKFENYLFVLTSTFLCALSFNFYKKYNIGSIIQTSVLFGCLVILSSVSYIYRNVGSYKKLVYEGLDHRSLAFSVADYVKYMFLLISVSLLGPGLTSTLFQTAPSITALFSKIFYGTKITKMSVLGIIITFIGIIIINILSFKNIILGGMSKNNLYFLLPLIGAFLQAYILVEVKKDKKQDPDEKVFSVSFFGLFISIIVSVIYLSSNNLRYKLQNFGISSFSLKPYNIFMNLITGILMYGAFRLAYRGLEKLKAIEVSIIMSLMPIFSYVIEYFIFKSIPHKHVIIGCAIIIIGSLIVSKGSYSVKINPNDSDNITKISLAPGLMTQITKFNS